MIFTVTDESHDTAQAINVLVCKARSVADASVVPILGLRWLHALSLEAPRLPLGPGGGRSTSAIVAKQLDWILPLSTERSVDGGKKIRGLQLPASDTSVIRLSRGRSNVRGGVLIQELDALESCP